MPNQPLLRSVLAYIAAVLVTYVIGAAAATQGALAHLPAIAQESIDFGVRMSTTAADLLGMLPAYAPLIAAALLAGFVVTAFVLRWLPDLRTFGYTLAGAVALLALHLIMRQTFDGIVPIASTRTTVGLLVQVFAGAVGGWLFARLGSGATRSHPSSG
ncbi:MAG: hypothetical protein ACR2PZ_23710 [Pseudomonadales bacterium]